MMAVEKTEIVTRGELRFNEPMSRHTSWRTGGTADLYFTPADRSDLISFLSQAADTPLTWVGLGSNLLVRDGGLRGAVIATHKCLNVIKTLGENRIYIESGVPGAKIARYSVRQGLTGAEFFAGIPGTFGGALAMNAGAFGAETWDVVSKVETIDEHGRPQVRDPEQFQVGYRTVSLPNGEWFLSGEIALDPGNVDAGRERIKKLLAHRASTQPIQSANAGSVFRNPTGEYAARLIEQCGLKGFRQGDAEISALHANFIVNNGQATAADIEALITHVQKTVLRVHGVELEHEVRIVGDHPE